MMFNPDSPPAYDTAELQHDLTGARRRRYDQCDATCTVDCGHCKGAWSLEDLWPSQVRDGRPINPDVDYVRAAAHRFGAVPDPAPERTDPATSLVWVAVFLCLVCAVAACGLGCLTVEIGRHWRGAAELATLGYWAICVLFRTQR